MCRQCWILFMLSVSLYACESPNVITAPTEARLREYDAIAPELGTRSRDRFIFRIIGLRLPPRGLIVDVLVAGDDGSTPKCAIQLAFDISTRFDPGRFVEIEDDNGKILALGPVVHRSYWPWGSVQYARPGQYEMASDNYRWKLIQTLELSGVSGLLEGEYRARFAPNVALLLKDAVPFEAECIEKCIFDTEWHTVSGIRISESDP